MKAGGAALIATGFMGGNGDKDMQMEDEQYIRPEGGLSGHQVGACSVVDSSAGNYRLVNHFKKFHGFFGLWLG